MLSLLTKLLLKLEPETAHACAMNLLKLQARRLPTQKTNEIGSLKVWNLDFPNPLGLAAGFDKNAECLLAWQNLGFGFAEVGTVTAMPQEGNPKPRIFRFPQEKALLNRMGFNNDGCVQIAKRIEDQRKKYKIKIPIGINIGKSKLVDLDEAASDYLKSFQTLADLADYMVINVSSPNTPGLRDLQNFERLKPLLEILCSTNTKRKKSIPLLLKISPDMESSDTINLAELALKYSLQGLIVSNTSIQHDLLPLSRQYGAGGLSGKVIFQKSTECLRLLSREYAQKIVLIASGGIMSPEQALIKKDAGASLFQLYTGFIYEGPLLISKICHVLERHKKSPRQIGALQTSEILDPII